MDDKNIRVNESVHKRLKARGDKGDTFSDIIEGLLDETENQNEK